MPPSNLRWDTNIMKHFPLLIAANITEVDLPVWYLDLSCLAMFLCVLLTARTRYPRWKHWNRYKPEGVVSCMSDGFCGLEHAATPKGAEACFEQAPKNSYVWS